MFRVALANLPFPESTADAVSRAVDAIARAGVERAELICFPECYVPGYRAPGKSVAVPNRDVLERAWSDIAEAAQRAGVATILGTERVLDTGLLISALVIDRDGTIEGFQDKVQLDPSEEPVFSPGTDRRVFTCGDVTFGIAICHEGWRYPETVRWAARNGAQVVFHPHFHEAEPGSYRPARFADPANTFHEKAALCRAAENTCFFATVNYASEGSPTTSAVVNPDGTVLAWQPYGREGLLIANLDLRLATRLLAGRAKPCLSTAPEAPLRAS
ncbi:MAG TPA: carbon-nitrogen hydrolase family protein [Vicinamibacterales bacterium]